MKSSFATRDLVLFRLGFFVIHTLHLSCEEVGYPIRTPSPVFFDLPHLLFPIRNMEDFLLSRTLPVRKTANVHGAYFDPG